MAHGRRPSGRGRFINAACSTSHGRVYAQALAEIRAAGLYKDERVIETPQGAVHPHRAGARC